MEEMGTRRAGAANGCATKAPPPLLDVRTRHVTVDAAAPVGAAGAAGLCQTYVRASADEACRGPCGLLVWRFEQVSSRR